MIEYINDLHFSQEDVDYLRSPGMFEEYFLEYLRHFRCSGDIYAIPEGTVVFSREPLVKVVAPIMEAQLVETALLNIINHQSLIATKTYRVVHAAQGDGVMEFGLRRAPGPGAVSYTPLRAHETGRNIVCRLLLEKKKKKGSYIL